MRLALALAVAVALAGCGQAITPRIATTFKLERKDAERVSISVGVLNQAERATVPLLIEVEAQTQRGAGWDKPVSVIHPAAFVLNRHEDRRIEFFLNTAAAVRATLTIKESERGVLLKTETAESPTAPR